MGKIQYIGTANKRVISVKDWEAAGVTNQEPVEWSTANGHVIDDYQLSADARAAIKADPFFVWFDDEDSDGKEPQVVQEVSLDADLAAETEKLAKDNSFTTDGHGLEEYTAPVEEPHDENGEIADTIASKTRTKK